MNASVFVCLILLITNVECFNRRNANKFSVISIACENLTRHLLDVEYDIFLVKYGDDVEPLATTIMKNLSGEKMPYRFNQLEESVIKVRSFNGFPMNGSGIFIFDSVQDFKNFSRGSLYYVNMFAKQFQFFVYCLDATYDDLATIDDIRLKHFFSFLLEDDLALKLLTFVWYGPSPEKCNIAKLTEINRFSKKTRLWNSQTFSIEKNRNFYGCKLTIAISHSRAQQRVYGNSSHSTDVHKKIFSGLARSLNYSLEFRWTVGKPNYSYDFTLDFYSLSGRFFYLDKYYNYYMHRFHMRPYFFRSVQLAAPIGEEFNDFEKLLLPYDVQVWDWIALTFAAAFFAIFILKFFARARNFIIGPTVSTPFLNVLMIFSGTSQVTMPGRNFARFLVMNFIIYSMIIRTAYQAKMFEFMQQEIRKPEVQSIDEMIEKNFTFFMDGPSTFLYKDSEFSKRARIQRVKTEELMLNYTPRLFDPTFKGAVQVFYDRLKIEAIATNGTFLKRIFKERLSMDMFSMRFGPLQKFFDLFDTKLQQLFVGGLIDFYEKDYEEFLKPERYEHLQQQGPQVLTLENLRAGFVVWLVSVSVAIVSFVFEWIRTFKDFFFVKSIFNAFYGQKIVNH